MFDCLHPESYNEDKRGRYVEVPIINPLQVPDDGVLGVLAGYISIFLVRGDLKRKFKEGGFKGGYFNSIAHSTDTIYKTWNSPKHKATE